MNVRFIFNIYIGDLTKSDEYFLYFISNEQLLTNSNTIKLFFFRIVPCILNCTFNCLITNPTDIKRRPDATSRSFCLIHGVLTRCLPKKIGGSSDYNS